MAQELLREELKTWVSGIEDPGILNLLKSLKDNQASADNWREELPQNLKDKINKSITEADTGDLIDHSHISKKYGI